jgi:two-component system, OmpR family, response regulator
MRVLVVEDESGLAEGLRRGLQAEGFAVDTVGDGNDALWRAREFQYDAMVLDIMLPGLNGFQVCSTLRAEGIWTPILMLSAKDGEHDQAEALDGGADAYLTKPFSFLVLVANLRALIRRGPRERPSKLRAGDLTVDPATHTADRGGTVIELTQREFSLLEALVALKDQAVSKKDLMERVWDAEFEGDPNIVEVYISRLRDKVDRPFEVESIETVRGYGYRLRSGS